MDDKKFQSLSKPQQDVVLKIAAEAERQGVNPKLAIAVAEAETGGKFGHFDKDKVLTSPAGARGVMQIMPDTARRFGVDSDRWASVESKLMNPRLNLQLGARYLRLLIDMFPARLDLALASYNAGEGAVLKAGKAIPEFKETQNYVAMVTQLYTVLKPPPVVAAPKPVRAQPYGPGFVLNASREPYTLVPSGRGNMVAPIRNAPLSESSIAD